MNEGPPLLLPVFGDLPIEAQAAVRLGWRGWQSPPEVLMAVWPQVPDLQARPEEVHETDWEQMLDAARATAEKRARWVWHDTASETVRLLPHSPQQRRCAIEASDALCMVTDDDACAAAAAACRTAVNAVGRPAARMVTSMAYSGCRPDADLMADCLSAVPTVNIGGRLYVA